jgi:exosome complex component RRP4
VGDIIIGTIVEIKNKRWKIDINSECEAYLHLNSTYLPEQRKKTEEDELNMRAMFKENDLVCAEVHCKFILIHNVNYNRLYF